MFIPLKDLNPHRTTPVINISLILANVLVFLYQFTLPQRTLEAFVMANATVPRHFAALLSGHGNFETTFLTLITSMFLHSGFIHIAGNMLFLWIFGDNVEDAFGHFGYLFFYLVCGVGASLVHILFNLNSNLPAVGASGAISGVMGAYLILYPRERILTLVFIFLLPIPAVFILVYWFVLQFLAGVSSLGMAATGGVAVWAHVGGFLIGMLLATIVKKR